MKITITASEVDPKTGREMSCIKQVDYLYLWDAKLDIARAAALAAAEEVHRALLRLPNKANGRIQNDIAH